MLLATSETKMILAFSLRDFMQIKVIKPLSIGSLFTCLFSSAKGQLIESYVAEVNLYTSGVDSLAIHHDATLAEGTISQQVSKVVYNGTSGKNDTIVKSEIIGGFSKETLSLGDTILRILYHDNVDENIYETFYFKNGQLVCSKVRLEADGIGNVLYNGIEYYRDGIHIDTISPPAEAKKKYRERIMFSWQEMGTKYYQEFKRHHS